MRTTLDDAWYLDAAAARVELGQGVEVETFLLVEMHLLSAGLLPDNFNAMNGVIREMAGSLIRPPFSGGLTATFATAPIGAGLWLGPGDGPAADHFTSEWTYVTVDGPLEIAVLLWYE